MSVLVAYASKHGATRGIAEHIAMRLREAGADAEAKPITGVHDPSGYDAFVIGSAVYFGSWQKDATRFVQRNRALLAQRPVWLFSSGPLGTQTTDAAGNDLRASAVPKQIAGLRAAIAPRDHRVFFGALDRNTFGLTEKLISALPAGRNLLQEGDFRDWDDIDAWAASIAQALATPPAKHV